MDKQKQAISKSQQKRSETMQPVQNVTVLEEAERHRKQVITDIENKIVRITTNTTMTEYQLRDMNDDLNRMFKSKTLWENRIKELGGPDYARTETKIFDDYGDEIPTIKGYRYFGLARDLPGVRDLLEKRPPREVKKYEIENLEGLDAEYYGFLPESIETRLAEYEKQQSDAIIDSIPQETSHKKQKTSYSVELMVDPLLVSVLIPSTREIEQHLIDRKKKELAEKYA